MNIRWSINKSNIINCILALTVQQEDNIKTKRLETKILAFQNK